MTPETSLLEKRNIEVGTSFFVLCAREPTSPPFRRVREATITTDLLSYAHGKV